MKVIIYKSLVTLLLTYMAETRPDSSVIKTILITSEMRDLQISADKTLWDKVEIQQ